MTDEKKRPKVELSMGDRYSFKIPPGKKSSLIARFLGWVDGVIFGPKDAASLVIADQRLHHLFRKIVFLLGLCALGVSSYILYCTIIKGVGYPAPCYAEYHMAWVAYLFPISASVVVFLVVLITMFRMSGKGAEKEPINVGRAIEIVSKLPNSGQP
jgi:uncharacterized membrane protein